MSGSRGQLCYSHVPLEIMLRVLCHSSLCQEPTGVRGLQVWVQEGRSRATTNLLCAHNTSNPNLAQDSQADTGEEMGGSPEQKGSACCY